MFSKYFVVSFRENLHPAAETILGTRAGALFRLRARVENIINRAQVWLGDERWGLSEEDVLI